MNSLCSLDIISKYGENKIRFYYFWTHFIVLVCVNNNNKIVNSTYNYWLWVSISDFIKYKFVINGLILYL